jgi:hypothetical protein
MKQIILNLSISIILLMSFSSCMDKIEDDYTDPDTSTVGYMGNLFTTMLLNNRIMPTYWDYATFVTGVTAKYSQFIGIGITSKMYVPSSDYNEDRWEAYYTGGIVNQYREIEKTYSNLTATKQVEQEVYLQIAKVVYYDQTSQVIDLWGDIPFSEAGSLNTTNTLTKAKFDDADSIYTTIIDGLKTINTFLDTVSVTSSVSTSLATQDILLGGDLKMWRRYANSLRLRLLMRISNVSESVAETAVTEMLNDTTTYPLVESNDQNILLEVNSSNSSFNSSGLESGLTDAATSNGPIAPEYLLEDVMVASNDPRTPVFWNKSSAGYVGLPIGSTTTTAESMLSNNLVSTIDSATFIKNINVPGVVFTAAEVSFLKAEAYERWGLGTASTAYETGISQSIDFYFDLNSSAVYSGYSATAETAPTTSEIASFIAGDSIAYSGTTTEKLAKIYTQKWLNFFILQAGQAWAEYRRTGYPALTFYDDPSYTSALQPPTRLLYPSTETTYNSTNYAAVSSEDTRDTKIFWAQ